jgi:antibiotic biosynthesis monooxygenase (ABM) superfamily enzyme
MSVLEAEVLEKLMELDVDARHRVIEAAIAAEVTSDKTKAWVEWNEKADALRDELARKYPGGTGIDVVALLREVRDED